MLSTFLGSYNPIYIRNSSVPIENIKKFSCTCVYLLPESKTILKTSWMFCYCNACRIVAGKYGALCSTLITRKDTYKPRIIYNNTTSLLELRSPTASDNA